MLTKAPTLTIMSYKMKPNINFLVLLSWFTRLTSKDANIHVIICCHCFLVEDIAIATEHVKNGKYCGRLDFDYYVF